MLNKMKRKGEKMIGTQDRNKLLTAAKCALADLEGIMPEFEASGDRTHPAWQTIKDLKKAIAIQRYLVVFVDGSGEVMVEMCEGKPGMEDIQVVRKVIRDCKKEGVIYYVQEAEQVIEI